MDLDELQRLLTWLAVLFFGIAAVALLGEFLQWWNDAGEIAITVATILGTLVALAAVGINSTKGQVRLVAAAVTTNGQKLDAQGRTLSSMDGQLDSANRKLDSANGKLDSANGKLDTIVVENRRQTSVLEQIRDRL